MSKWKKLEESEEIKYMLHGATVVTRRHNVFNGKKQIDVALAYPGWNAKNNGVLAYMEIESPKKNRDGWYSEYNGDLPPDKSGWYLAAIQTLDEAYTRITELLYNCEKDYWYAVPEGWEVMLYRPFPKPYRSC